MSIYSGLKKIYYIILDGVTLGKGIPVSLNSFSLKLPTKYYRLFPKDYEESSFVFFKKHAKKGGTTLDIGAHIGLYSVFFANITQGKVYSFEPTPSTAKVLRQTIAINKLDNQVTVVQAAIAEKPGTATFYSADMDVSTSNSLVEIDLGKDLNRQGAYEVQVLSIDSFRLQHKLKIGFLKIDAEGVEIEALKGAKETFLQDRPIAILGLHPFAYENRKETLSIIWDILKGYHLQIQMAGKDISKETFCDNEETVFDVELLPQ